MYLIFKQLFSIVKVMLGWLRALFMYLVIGLTFICSYFSFKILSIIKYKNEFEIKRNIFTNIFLSLFKLIFWIQIDIDSQYIIDLKKEKYLFLCNHISFMDLFLLVFLSSKFKNKHLCKFVGMQKIFDWMIAGYVLKELGMIPIKMLPDKNNQNQYCEESKKLLKLRCKEELIKGNSIFIFPEGRLNNNPLKLNKIHSGAYYLSKETNTPIKFIGLKNVHKIWKRNDHPIGLGKINIKIFEKKYDFSNDREFKNEFKKTIELWIKNI